MPSCAARDRRPVAESDRKECDGKKGFTTRIGGVRSMLDSTLGNRTRKDIFAQGQCRLQTVVCSAKWDNSEQK